MTSIPDTNDCYAGKREEQKEIRYKEMKQECKKNTTNEMAKAEQMMGWWSEQLVGAVFVQSSNQDKIPLFGVSCVLFLEYSIININIYFNQNFNRKLPCSNVTGNIQKPHN